ncbi:hypothetical protein GOP47_0010208, partial [Adiantum capillus-veneris]
LRKPLGTALRDCACWHTQMSTPGSSSKSRRRSNAGTGDSTPRTSPSSRAGDGALVFRVVEVDSQDGDFGATLWMPPSAMLSASLSASQLVCATISPQGHDDLDMSGLKKQENKCFGHYELDFKNKEVHGSFCVIASAWPSGKLKEGIKVSKQLAYALGCLHASPLVYLNPISCPKLNSCEGSQLKSTFSLEVDIEECKEIVLKLNPMISEDIVVNTSLLSPLLSGLQQGKTLEEKQGESPSSFRIRKAASSNLTPKKDPSQAMQLKEQCALLSLLGDENSSASKLLERLAGRLLHGRYLLKGNRVGITVCGHEYLFEVVDAVGQSEGRSTNACQEGIKASADKEMNLMM